MVLAGNVLGGGKGGYIEGARVYNSADIVLANGATVLLTFDSERYDTDDIHSIASNTSRLTCKTAGKYFIVAQVRFTANPNGNMRYLALHLNGTTIIAQNTPYQSKSESSSVEIITIYDLAVNDYIEVKAYQDSGSTLNAEYKFNSSPEFMMQRIG